MIQIKENIKVLEKLHTKPLEKRSERGKSPFKTQEERMNFKSDVLKLKYEGYCNQDIADYFVISESTVANVSKEYRQHIETEFRKEQSDLLLDFLGDFKVTFLKIKEELNKIDEKDFNNRSKYYTIILKYYSEMAGLLGLQSTKLSIQDTEDPIEKIWRLMGEKKKPTKVKKTTIPEVEVDN